jgi:hypothetical protein
VENPARGKIQKIYFPNSVADSEQAYYTVGTTCDEIREINKNGEMALVGWLQVIKDGSVIAEIKESVCDLFFI